MRISRYGWISRLTTFGPTFLFLLLAVCGALATLCGTGNMMLTNQMALAFNSESGIPKALIGDIANAFMALPHLIALTLLSGTEAATAREFFWKYPRIEDFDK